MTAETAKGVVSKVGDVVKKKEEKSKEKKDKESPPTKVVIRRLPPTLTPEVFLEQISPVPDHSYFDFVPAGEELGPAAFCRAYINFENVEDVFIFTEKFDNYIFIDSKGNEYPAIVEYAPYQKVPKKKQKKADSRKGTIENDSDYIKFLEQLENPSTGDVTFTPESILEELEIKEKEMKANHGVLKISTPLLDYIRKKKEEKKQANFKMREERKKREEERRRKRDEERKKKRDRDRERQRERERQRLRERDKEREQEQKKKEKGKSGDSSQPMKLLTKQEKEDNYTKSSQGRRSDNEYNSENTDKKYDGSKDTRPKTSDRSKEGTNDRELERRERERRRREKEDEQERKWQERERDRKDRRDKERRDREKKEKERREKDRERREKGRMEREIEREKDFKLEEENDQERKKDQEELNVQSDSTNTVPSVDKTTVKDVMVESTSSIEDQPSSSNEAPDKPKDKHRQRARYKDRPERQIYNPGQRAAERRKQMEARSGKESTPDSVKAEGSTYSEKTDSNNSSRRNSVGSSHSPRDT